MERTFRWEDQRGYYSRDRLIDRGDPRKIPSGFKVEFKLIIDYNSKSIEIEKRRLKQKREWIEPSDSIFNSLWPKGQFVVADVTVLSSSLNQSE